MIGCYDFCGHYEWTFAWLEQQAGAKAVNAFWDEAIGHDSQLHARTLFINEGLAGMRKYWEHTLEEEAAGYAFTVKSDVARIDMHECPSKGFLLRNKLEQYSDYCDHCIGWIGPVMRDAGFVVDHEHNHGGQCWWEFRQKDDFSEPSRPGAIAEEKSDVRLKPNWDSSPEAIDVFARVFSADGKRPNNAKGDSVG